MAETFRLNNLGILFRVKLVDCKLDEDFDTDNVVDQFIIFEKPDGTKLVMPATLVEDPNGSGIFFIEFIDTNGILDLIGNWSYTGKIITTSPAQELTSASVIFWVE